MNAIGSFYPLSGDDQNADPVLFALTTPTPKQRMAVYEEAIARLAAAQALSEALLTVQLEAPDRRCHLPFLEAVAILSRDAKGLLEATKQAEA